jgi:hypothetical protein
MATFESELGQKFGPTYHASRNERDYLAQLEPQKEPRLGLAHPPWRPYVYFSVLALGTSGGTRVYEINYLTIWEWDAGLQRGPVIIGPHRWDIERTATFVAGPKGRHDPGAYKVRQTYYASHERVRLGGVLSLDNSRYVKYRRGLERGPDVWWSKGKHASFPDLDALGGSTARDSYQKPGEVARPGEYSLTDVGTLEQPSSEALWITYKSRWGPHRISSVYSKLKDRLWDAAGNALRDVPIVTKADIMLAQSVLKVDKPTGQLDEKTLQRAAAVLPARRVWTTRKITRAEVAELKAHRRIDVSPLL